MHHLLEHINQDIERRNSKDKDSTVNKTEYQSKKNPTGKPQWAGPTVKLSVPYHLINRTVIKSEVRPAGMQLKRKAKLLTVIGLTTKHAVCCNTLIL